MTDITAEPMEPGFAECKDSGRRVFIPTNKGSVALIDYYNELTDQYQCTVEDTGEAIILPSHAIRWKAIDDLYRDNYEVHNQIKTASGSPSTHCGDDISYTLLGLSEPELEAIAKENDLEDSWRRWKDGGRSQGMCRMNLGNRLRKMQRDHEKAPNQVPPPMVNHVPVTVVGEERKMYFKSKGVI